MVLVGSLPLRLSVSIMSSGIGSVWKTKLGYDFAFCRSEILYDELYYRMRCVSFGTGYDIVYTKSISFHDDFKAVSLKDIIDIDDVWITDTGIVVTIKSFETHSLGLLSSGKDNMLSSITIADENEKLSSPEPHIFITNYRKDNTRCYYER